MGTLLTLMNYGLLTAFTVLDMEWIRTIPLLDAFFHISATIPFALPGFFPKNLNT
jgi:hypothetical protein